MVRKFFQYVISDNYVNVDHQHRLCMSDDWGPTRVRRERCDELTSFEVIPRSKHQTWNAPSSYQGTMAALKTV